MPNKTIFAHEFVLKFKSNDPQPKSISSDAVNDFQKNIRDIRKIETLNQYVHEK